MKDVYLRIVEKRLDQNTQTEYTIWEALDEDESIFAFTVNDEQQPNSLRISILSGVFMYASYDDVIEAVCADMDQKRSERNG